MQCSALKKILLEFSTLHDAFEQTARQLSGNPTLPSEFFRTQFALNGAVRLGTVKMHAFPQDLTVLQELKAAFERLIAAFLTGEKAEIAKQITAFVFYWYNFMPIARGTAVCGHTAILALFAAADMPITATIPKVIRKSC